MTEAVIRAFEEDPSLIGRLLGIDLPGNVTVTRLEEYIPDPKTIERDLHEAFLEGFRWGLAGAVMRVLQYREIAADRETLTRIAHERDSRAIAAWLDRATTARIASDLFD